VLVAIARTCLHGAVVGGVVMVVILVLAPIVICLSAVVMAGIIGWLVKSDVDEAFVDSEHLELGR
jgi:mannitol-specific phosphotransferase system IIBC component